MTRRVLLAAGVRSKQIQRRLDRWTLHAVHPGVYLVGHTAPSLEARFLAAVDACGEGAVLCGFAAAYLYGLLKGSRPPPEVTAATKRRVRGVITHRARTLDPRDRTTFRGIPITTVQRTVTDLAGASPWTTSRSPTTRPRSVTA